MTPTGFADLLSMLKADEGTGPVRDGHMLLYQDPVGKWTIGYGHNLTDNGLKAKFAHMILEDDVVDHLTDLTRRFPIVNVLSDNRQIALANAAYNLGVPGLAGFHNLWAAVGVGDFKAAARELLDSKAARQTGDRYQRLAALLERG